MSIRCHYCGCDMRGHKQISCDYCAPDYFGFGSEDEKKKLIQKAGKELFVKKEKFASLKWNDLLYRIRSCEDGSGAMIMIVDGNFIERE